MTELQQRIIDAYGKYGAKDDNLNTKENYIEMAKEVYGNEQAINKVQAMIGSMKYARKWPFSKEEKKEEKSPQTAILSYDKETDTIVRFTKYLNCLENSSSMKRIIETIKNGAFTKNEMYILTEMAKMFDDLDDEERQRVFNYIGERFKL